MKNLKTLGFVLLAGMFNKCEAKEKMMISENVGFQSKTAVYVATAKLLIFKSAKPKHSVLKGTEPQV
ncbi:hypothetical protein [Kaistella palustris]|uniref:hypothetical protein n=1 Tax=Kaistella palustris TaxID=493376 RepID=UPI0004246612|nr:hypothetical protein [Kaistella palustris]